MQSTSVPERFRPYVEATEELGRRFAAAGRALLDALPISPADKTKVAGLNAERLLRLT